MILRIGAKDGVDLFPTNDFRSVNTLLNVAIECFQDIRNLKEETDDLVRRFLSRHELTFKQLAYLLVVTRDEEEVARGYTRDEVMILLGWTKDDWDPLKDESRTREGCQKTIEKLADIGLWPSDLLVFFNTVPSVPGMLPLPLALRHLAKSCHTQRASVDDPALISAGRECSLEQRQEIKEIAELPGASVDDPTLISAADWKECSLEDNAKKIKEIAELPGRWEAEGGNHPEQNFKYVQRSFRPARPIDQKST